MKYFFRRVNVTALHILVLLCGGSWTTSLLLHLKRGAKQVEEIPKPLLDIFGDIGQANDMLSIIRPDVQLTNENVKTLVSDMLRTVLPNIDKLSGLDCLVEAHLFGEKLKNQKSDTLIDPDFLYGSIELLYQENARLRQRSIEQTQVITELNATVSSLKARELDSTSVDISTPVPHCRNHKDPLR